MAGGGGDPGAQPDVPGDRIDWDTLRADLDRKANMLLAHALVHYIDRGHPFEMKMRSANALSWIEHGPYVMLVRLDDSPEFCDQGRAGAGEGAAELRGWASVCTRRSKAARDHPSWRRAHQSKPSRSRALR